jgi:CRISPR/Cas system CMR-associated protein Cmr3 (group 5 of RAMP superfamily)
LSILELEQRIAQAIKKDKKTKKSNYIVSVRFIETKDGTIADLICESESQIRVCQTVKIEMRKSRKWLSAAQYEH